MNENIERLLQLHPEDAKSFVNLRRSLIAELVESSAANTDDLSSLQREIDCHLATSMAPRQSINLLMELLEVRVAELKQLSERLVRLRTSTPM